jgi:hypothetical protein
VIVHVWKYYFPSLLLTDTLQVFHFANHPTCDTSIFRINYLDFSVSFLHEVSLSRLMLVFLVHLEQLKYLIVGQILASKIFCHQVIDIFTSPSVSRSIFLHNSLVLFFCTPVVNLNILQIDDCNHTTS